MRPHFHGRFTEDLSGVDPLSVEVFRAFKTAMLKQTQLMFRMMAREGTHPAQAGCLRMLIEHDGISQRDLAEAMHVSRPTITTMLQKMEKSGLVERRVDEHDQRLMRIYLTDAGRTLSSSLDAVFGEVVEVGFGSMSEADRHELLRLLEDMNARLTKALAEGPGSDDTDAQTGQETSPA